MANLNFYLLAAGIASGMVAEMMLPALVSLTLGAISGACEITAVVLFMPVLYQTARQSIGPYNTYEKFMATSFVVGAIFLKASRRFASSIGLGPRSLLFKLGRR